MSDQAEEIAAALRHIAAGVERLADAIGAPAKPAVAAPTAAAEPVDPFAGHPFTKKRQVAAHLDVSVRTLSKWNRAGLPHRLAGGVTLYRLAEVDQWLAQQRG